jgi:hypothetical protein
MQYSIGLIQFVLHGVLRTNASVCTWTLQQISNNNLVAFSHELDKSLLHKPGTIKFTKMKPKVHSWDKHHTSTELGAL